MRKNVFFLGALLSSITIFSQVGINTDQPKTTLEVVGKPANFNIADGIIVPRLTGNELQAKDAVYTNEQNSAIVYVTARVSGTPVGKTINVTAPGYYYYNQPTISDAGTWKLLHFSPNTSLLKASKTGNWSLINLSGGWKKIPLASTDVTIGLTSLINSNGEYIVPFNGVYQIKYEIRTQGVNAGLLGASYLGLIKNTSTTPIEQKQIDGVTLSLLGLINIANIPIGSTTLDTLLQLQAGDRITLGFNDGGLNLGLLTDKKISFYIYKISD